MYRADPRKWRPAPALTLLLALNLAACGNDDDPAQSGDDTTTATTTDATPDSQEDSTPTPPALPDDLTADWYGKGAPWKPGVHLPLAATVLHGELRDVRGLIHAHSIYSHDACDGKPVDEQGNDNLACLKDFRDDLCDVGHDFVLLTDHPDRLIDHEYPDLVLYDAKRGDTLVQRGGLTVANRAGCPGQRPTLIVAGCEGDTMPVGLEGHAGATKAERQKAYRGNASVDSFKRLHDNGALVLAQHTEDWTVDQLATLPFDGFEMYNVHANMVSKFKIIAQLLPLLTEEGKFPSPDLLLLPLVDEDPRYLETWGSLLARGVKRVGTMGTDCHQNTLTLKLADGERVDRYRRIMAWFSNHLLIAPKPDGSFDDRTLKDALKAGRNYGVFEVLGYAQGFDFHAREGGTAAQIGARMEMGSEPSLAKGVELVVRRPTVARRDPKSEAPKLILRLLRAREKGFDIVAETTSGDLRWTVDKPGAYRAEVRMVPSHLKAFAGGVPEIATREVVWILANPVYVKP